MSVLTEQHLQELVDERRRDYAAEEATTQPVRVDMSKPVNVNGSAMMAALQELADAAKLAYDVPHAAGTICAAVANLIAGAGNGSAGGVQQQRMMRAAEACGFTPEYYGAGIRVTYTPKG